MKTISIFLILLGIPFCCLSQDIIYMKDKSIQKTKILEVSTDKVRYKKVEIIDGPTYEVLKSDVLKIQYSNGFVDYFVPKTDTLSSKKSEKQQKHDSIDYSMLYIVFNSGQDETLKFPVYINGKHIVTLENHMRATYKIFSEGYILLERSGIKTYGKGPMINFDIQHGDFYGIRISVLNPQGFTSSRRVSLTLIDDSTDFKAFLKNEFYGFQPFKQCDIKMIEDKQYPIIQE